MVAVDAKTSGMRDPVSAPLQATHYVGGGRGLFARGLEGAVGCYLSHMECWRRCVDSQQPCVVIEDDMYFDMQKSMLTEAYNSIPEDAEFAPLIYIPMSSGGTCADGWCTISARTFAGTQCYYITPAGAQKLLGRRSPWSPRRCVYRLFGGGRSRFQSYWHEKNIWDVLNFCVTI